MIFWIILSYQVFWYRVFLKCIESTFSNQNLTIYSVMQYRVATSLWNLENLEKHQFLAKVREKVWEREQVRKKSRLFLCKLSNVFCFLVFCLFRFLSLSTSYVALIIILYLFIYLFIYLVIYLFSYLFIYVFIYLLLLFICFLFYILYSNYYSLSWNQNSIMYRKLFCPLLMMFPIKLLLRWCTVMPLMRKTA